MTHTRTHTRTHTDTHTQTHTHTDTDTHTPSQVLGPCPLFRGEDKGVVLEGGEGSDDTAMIVPVKNSKVCKPGTVKTEVKREAEKEVEKEVGVKRERGRVKAEDAPVASSGSSPLKRRRQR